MENITSKGTIFGTLIAQAGPKGDTGKTGDRGLTGEAGYSPIKGVDYFTQEDISEIRKGIEGDLTGEYNKNAIEKTNIFNTNAKETTTSFDLNAENKTKEYNDNALAEIEKYNSNAIEKSNNFDTNFENKTSKFDSNYDEKTKEFNDNNDLGIQNYNNNAKKQMEIFDTNFTEKLEAFNNNAGTKFNGFNANSDKAFAEYNKNHTAKMKEFDDNYDTKTKTFDDNAAAKLEAYNKNDKTKTDAYNNNASNKEETFNTNAADKQNEFNENASDKLAEYNQNAKELINKVEQVQAENESLKAENKLIKEQIPSANMSGNNIHIEDSGSLELEWRLKGGNWQKTREGYNKIDLSSISTEVAGIKALYDNETGYITVNGTSTQHYPAFYEKNINELLTDGETWTVWQENAPSDTNHEIYLQVTAVNKAGGATRYYTSATKGKRTSFVIDKEQYTYTLNFMGGTISNIGTLTNYKNRYMLYKGTDDKEYEQYGATPSPDYQSKTETVGNNVNYFDENTVESKFLNSKTGRTSDNNSWRCTDFIEILSKQYNFSWESDSSYFQATVCYYDKNKTFISGDEYGLWGIYSKTFEIPDGANYMKVAHSITVAGKPVIRDKIKLEIGNKRTLYSPYMCGSVEIDVVNSNLIDFNVTQDSRVTVNEDGTLTINGAGGFSLNIDKLQLKAGITYYQKVELISGSISGANINNTFLSFAGTEKWISSEIFTKSSFNEDTKKTAIWINASAIFNNAVIKIWANTDKSDFVKHQSQTAIMPIQQEMLEGDYIKDVEHHEWQKFIFDGVTNRLNQKTGTSANNLYYTSYISNLLAPTSNGVKIEICSNCFKSYTANQLYGQDLVGVAVTTGKSFSIGFGLESSIDTLDKANEKLKELYDAGTPIIIYYKLAEAIDLELTSEQKAVRNQKLYTYKNITNIDVSDELASIDVEYKKDPTTEHNKLQNQIDEIKQLISTTETSALLLDNLQKDVEMEVE